MSSVTTVAPATRPTPAGATPSAGRSTPRFSARSATRAVPPVLGTDSRPTTLPRPAVRLTRRGRAVRTALLGLVLVVTVLVAVVAWGPGVVATPDSGQPVPVRTVTVQPGDTLWDIAVASGVGGDPRDVVDRIQELNALADAGDLQVGESLAVPLS